MRTPILTLAFVATLAAACAAETDEATASTEDAISVAGGDTACAAKKKSLVAKGRKLAGSYFACAPEGRFRVACGTDGKVLKDKRAIPCGSCTDEGSNAVCASPIQLGGATCRFAKGTTSSAQAGEETLDPNTKVYRNEVLLKFELEQVGVMTWELDHTFQDGSTIPTQRFTEKQDEGFKHGFYLPLVYSEAEWGPQFGPAADHGTVRLHCVNGSLTIPYSFVRLKAPPAG